MQASHCKYLETTVAMPILQEPSNCLQVHLINQIIGGSPDQLIGTQLCIPCNVLHGCPNEAQIEGRFEGLLDSWKSLICFQKIKEALPLSFTLLEDWQGLLWISSNVSTEYQLCAYFLVFSQFTEFSSQFVQFSRSTLDRTL